MSVRYRFLAPATALLATVAIAACGSSSGESSGGGKSGEATPASESESGEPLKVALIPPTSGALAIFGTATVEAWEFAAEQANAEGGVDGHKVELIKEHTDGTPPSTLLAARKAVTQEGAHFISAVMTSPENGALQQQLASLNALSFNDTGEENELTGSECSAYSMRSTQDVEMNLNTIAAVLSKLPAKTWAVQAVDYSTGHDAAAEFKKAAEKVGDKVVAEEYAPLNTTEFGSYITKISESKAEGIFAVEYGADAIAFVKQGTQFGLFKKTKVVLGYSMLSEPLFPAVGSAAIGFYNNVNYAHEIKNPMNEKFVEEWEAKYKSVPYYVQADAYLAAQTLFEAVKKAKSIEPEKVKEALGGLTFNSIVGEVTVRPGDHQLLRPTYVGQIVKEQGGSGGLGWKIIAEEPASVTTPNANPKCKL